jgi:hypothetical protein
MRARGAAEARTVGRHCESMRNLAAVQPRRQPARATDVKGGIPEPEDPFDVVLDEDFIKGATAEEPTARTRELSAKWAEEPQQATGRRTDGPTDRGRPSPGRRRTGTDSRSSASGRATC